MNKELANQILVYCGLSGIEDLNPMLREDHEFEEFLEHLEYTFSISKREAEAALLHLSDRGSIKGSVDRSTDIFVSTFGDNNICFSQRWHKPNFTFSEIQ